MIKDPKPLKILILMSYYNRPILVKNALNSILKANEQHQNWVLGFGDDGSKIPGRPIVEEALKDHLDKITFVDTGMTFDDKIERGLMLGYFANQVMRESDADVALMLCDDDELHPSYLANLSSYFNSNPEVLYGYCKLYIYNPLMQKSEDVSNMSGRWNVPNTPINPVNKVDASQVAWRLDCCKKHGAWFKESTKCVPGKPWTKDTDKSFFENLYEHCGECHPFGFVGQYKGVHDYQLLWHKDVPAASLYAYEKMCVDLGGVRF